MSALALEYVCNFLKNFSQSKKFQLCPGVIPMFSKESLNMKLSFLYYESTYFIIRVDQKWSLKHNAPILQN